MTPWVTRLLIANVLTFFLTAIVPVLPDRYLVLVPVLIPIRPWTLVTYAFLHAGFTHLLFNMLGLYFFGPRLEARLGGAAFLGLYLTSAMFGALLSWPFTPKVPIVGASGAVFGVLLGYARYWPRDQIYIWGIVPVEARVLVLLLTVMSLSCGIQGGGGVAHFAHLGGFLGGWLFLKWRESRSPAARFKAKARTVPKARDLATPDLKEWAASRREQMHPVNRAELDRILDKIGATGVASLSPDERAFLERFREG